jgi:hypothetical protein
MNPQTLTTQTPAAAAADANTVAAAGTDYLLKAHAAVANKTSRWDEVTAYLLLDIANSLRIIAAGGLPKATEHKAATQ